MSGDWTGFPVWNARTGKVVASLTAGLGLSAIPFGMRVSPDGKLIAFHLVDAIRIVDANQNAELGSWRNAIAPSNSSEKNESSGSKVADTDLLVGLEFTPDSRQVLQISRGGILEVREA